MTSINVSSGNPYDRTNLIVGLRFRGLRGPVDQPGTQRVRAGRRSPAWPVILDPECGKALTLLRRAAGSNPARSTTNSLSWSYRRVQNDDRAFGSILCRVDSPLGSKRSTRPQARRSNVTNHRRKATL